MFCSKCGTRNEENTKFCYNCGNRLEVDGSVMEQSQAPVNDTFSQPQTPASDYVYSQPQAPTSDYAYSQPQANQPIQPAYQPQVPYGQPVNQPVTASGKSRKPLILALAGIAAIAAIILCVTLLFPSGSGKVLDNILRAARGTVEGKSVEFTAELVEYYSGKTKDKVSGVMVYDLNKGKIEYDIEQERNRRQILYDGIMYEINGGEVWWTEDFSDEIDDIIDIYKEYKDGMNGLSKLDWEDAIKKFGLSRFVDTDKLDKCLKQFEKNLNSKSYFEKVCDEFSIEKTSKGTKYVFDVDVPKLIESLIDTFEPAIDADIDDVKDGILDEVDVFEKLLIEITIKNDKLVELHIDVSMEDWYGDIERNELTISLKNFGKASLDEDEIEDLIDNTYDFE